MPTYQYRCTECGRDLEVVQKFSDASLTECPTCSGALRKVFNAVGVVFKGSGFYRNDSRAANGNGGSDSSDGEKTTEKSGEKTEKAPDSSPAKTETTKTDVKKSETNGAKVSSGSGSSSTGSTTASS